MKSLLAILLGALFFCGCSDSREELLQELANSSPVKRSGALRVLAREGDEEAYLLVSQALEDQSAIVRIAAVRALADFKDRDTTAALVRATRDADPEVREAAVMALAARGGQPVRRALVNMLLRAERSPRVRGHIYSALKEMGLSGQQLAEEMAALQMDMIGRQWKDSRGSRRAHLVRLAGRSVHPDAMRVVLDGLADRNVDVALAALSVLDGRGGKAALRQLLLLASDQSVRIRKEAVKALRHYGREGVAVLGGVLRDLHPEVRLRALEELGKVEQDLSPEMVCPLLSDKEQNVMLQAAKLVHTKALQCDLSVLAGILRDPENDRYRAAVQALSLLGGEPAHKMLADAMKKQPAAYRPFLAAARARAGDRNAKTKILLEKELQHLIKEIYLRSQSWVTGKLPPWEKAPEESADHTRLTEEQLKKLYEKHGLSPASKDAPRGISDILAKFEEPSGPGPSREIFEPITPDDVEVFGVLLEGLASIDPASAAAVVGETLPIKHPELMGRAARVVQEKGIGLDLGEDQIGQLGGLLSGAGEQDTGAIARLLSSTKNPKAIQVLGSALPGMSWEKREHVIAALGRMGRQEGIQPLVEMLSGYSAASAARALGEIGNPAAIEPLREAQKRAGPSAEMDIVIALSKLGCEDVVPMVSERLSDPDPEVRRAAVRILGMLGGTQAQEALEAVRYDLDRLVRAEAGNYLMQSLRKK